MRNEKRTRALLPVALAVLVVLCLAAEGFLLRQSEPTAAPVEQPLALIKRGGDDVRSVSIARRGEALYTLLVEKDGEGAPVYALAGDPEFTLSNARTAAIVRYGLSLAGWEEIDLAGRSLADFGLADPALRVVFGYPDSETTLSIGDEIPSGGYRYVQVNDEPVIHTIFSSIAAVFDVPPQDLHARTLPVQLNASYPSRVAIDYGNASHVELAYRDEDSDEILSISPPNAQVDQQAAKALYRNISLRLLGGGDEDPPLDAYIGRAKSDAQKAFFGLDAPRMTVYLEDSEGHAITFAFGHQREDGFVYTMLNDGSDVYAMDSDRLDILDRSRLRELLSDGGAMS